MSYQNAIYQEKVRLNNQQMQILPMPVGYQSLRQHGMYIVSLCDSLFETYYNCENENSNVDLNNTTECIERYFNMYNKLSQFFTKGLKTGRCLIVDNVINLVIKDDLQSNTNHQYVNDAFFMMVNQIQERYIDHIALDEKQFNKEHISIDKVINFFKEFTPNLLRYIVIYNAEEKTVKKYLYDTIN